MSQVGGIALRNPLCAEGALAYRRRARFASLDGLPRLAEAPAPQGAVAPGARLPSNRGMALADDRTKPVPAPFISASARFAAGADSPRAFLERCLEQLEAWEARIGAFVHLDIAGARAAADRASARWQGGPPPSPVAGTPPGA